MHSVVLYTTDFEPITVIDLPPWAMDMLAEHDMVTLPVYEPLHRMPAFDQFGPITDTVKTVTIRVQHINWIDRRSRVVLITSDEVHALLLDPGFLPGQRGPVNRMVHRVLVAERLASMLLNVLVERGRSA